MTDLSLKYLSLLFLFVLLPGLVSADLSKFEELKPVEEHLRMISDTYKFARFESEVSNPIEGANGNVYPVTLSFLFFGDENILPFINDMEKLQGSDISLRVYAISVSPTAESRPADHEPLLSASIIASVCNGPEASGKPLFRTALLEAALNKDSFTFGVQRKQAVEGIDLWLSSFRLGHADKDAVMITFTGCAFKFAKITEYINRLATADAKMEIMANSINSTQYSGIPVYRFDLAAVEGKDHPLPRHAMSIIDLIDTAVSSSNGRISSLRIAPPIRIKDIFGLPIELSVENLVIDEWNALKRTLSELKGEKVSVTGISDKGMTDEGFTIRLKVVVEP